MDLSKAFGNYGAFSAAVPLGNDAATVDEPETELPLPVAPILEAPDVVVFDSEEAMRLLLEEQYTIRLAIDKNDAHLICMFITVLVISLILTSRK